MGKDGAQGLLRMKNAGAYTIAQNEETCVVYGMPKEAVALGAVHTSLALDDIAQAVLERIGKTAT
jgi:two-component system chemotaxis response regulator CheB